MIYYIIMNGHNREKINIIILLTEHHHIISKDKNRRGYYHEKENNYQNAIRADSICPDVHYHPPDDR